MATHRAPPIRVWVHACMHVHVYIYNTHLASCSPSVAACVDRPPAISRFSMTKAAPPLGIGITWWKGQWTVCGPFSTVCMCIHGGCYWGVSWLSKPGLVIGMDTCTVISGGYLASKQATKRPDNSPATALLLCIFFDWFWALSGLSAQGS